MLKRLEKRGSNPGFYLDLACSLIGCWRAHVAHGMRHCIVSVFESSNKVCNLYRDLNQWTHENLPYVILTNGVFPSERTKSGQYENRVIYTLCGLPEHERVVP